VPAEPFSPKIISSTIIAALVTFLLGCAFVIMREFLSGNALTRIEDNQMDYPLTGAGTGRATVEGGRSYASAGLGHQISAGSFDQKDTLGWERGYNPRVTSYRMDADFAEDEPEAQDFIESASSVENEDAVAIPDARVSESQDQDSDTKPRYDQDFAPDWVGDLRGPGSDREPEFVAEEQQVEEAAAENSYAETATTYAQDIEARGRIVVLSVDDEALSHDLTFDLARKAAEAGKSALIMEVFPEQSDSKAAEGFSDVVAGQAPFAKVVYRDAGSKAHIIEAGRITITDDMADGERFKHALDAIKSTYDTIVVDLGAIDGTLASARMLSFADRVLIAASAPDHSHELQSAANLLAHNTGAKVEVVIAGDDGPGPRQSDDGHAA
jgi:Mrp family chromosome partitioning ATPase